MLHATRTVGFSVILAASISVAGGATALAQIETIDDPAWVMPYRIDGGDSSLLGSGACFVGSSLVVTARNASTSSGPLAGVFLEIPRGTNGYSIGPIVGSPDSCFANAVSACQFGLSVASDGGRLFVTSRAGATPADGVGAIYCFVKQPDGWELTQTIRGPLDNSSSFQSSFGVSMAAGGGWVAVSAAFYDESGHDSQRGAVFLYQQTADGRLALKQVLRPPVASPLTQGFGVDLDLDGDLLIVGGLDGGTGTAFVYQRQSSDDWLLTDELSGGFPGNAANRFGRVVAIDATSGAAAVSHVPSVNNTGTGEGAVWLYEADVIGGGFSLVDVLQPLRPSPGSAPFSAGFGSSLDFDGPMLAVGSPNEPAAGWHEGVVHVFEREAEWDRTRVLGISVDEVGEEASGFGEQLALDRGRLLVGQPRWGPADQSQGTARLFELSLGSEFCGGSSVQPSLALMPSPSVEGGAVASVHGLPGPGVGVLAAGTPSFPTPYGSGGLCLGAPSRISGVVSFDLGASSVYVEVSPAPAAMLSGLGLQFVFASAAGGFPGGASLAVRVP